MCGGILAYLGTLGRNTWWRCIHCGHDQCAWVETLDDETLEMIQEVEDS
jgi:hypothetical protein